MSRPSFLVRARLIMEVTSWQIRGYELANSIATTDGSS